jgi:hypothetical protein
VDEKGTRTGEINDQHPKATRLALARTRDPLFDNTAPKIGGRQSSFGIPDRLVQQSIGDTRLPCKACKRFVFGYSHV